MKTREEIQKRLKQLVLKQKDIWKDDKPFKNDRVQEVEIEISTLKWVLRPIKRQKENCFHTHVKEIQGGQVEKCLDCGKLF